MKITIFGFVILTSAYTSGPGISLNPGVTLVWLNYLSENKRSSI